MMIFPGPLSIEQLLAHRPAQPEGVREVDLDHRIPLFVGVLRGGVTPDDAGVVHQDVDAAERRQRVGNQPIGSGAIGEVGGEERRARGRGRRQIFAAVASAGCSLLCNATSAPADARATAIAAPRPREAPVTSATLPSSLNASRKGMTSTWSRPSSA